MLIFDIEANGFYDTVTAIHQISIIDYETGARESYHGSSLDAGVVRLAEADILVAHNGILYDIPVIEKVTGVALNPRRCIDTLVMSRLGRPIRDGGHSLEAWGQRLGDAPVKIEHEDWTKWSPEMEARCNADVEITLHLYERLKSLLDAMPDAFDTDTEVVIAVGKMVRRGFLLDVDKAHEVLDEKLEQSRKLLDEFQTIFPPVWMPKQPHPKVYKTVNKKALDIYPGIEPGVKFSPIELEHFKPSARQQVARRLKQKYGWRPTHLTPSGAPKVDEAVLNTLPYPEAKKFSQYLENEKLIGQINGERGWLHNLQPNGRVSPEFIPTGANTHRSACRNPNLQQVSKAQEMRECWIAEPGKVLVGVDASGLELRCLAHYLARYDGGKYADILMNGDIHSHIQKLIGFATRDKTKNAEYGWLYGAGNAKLGEIAREDAKYGNVEVDPRISNSKLGAAMRRNLVQGIDGLEKLILAVNKAASTGKMLGIDKRPLWVRSEHSALNLLLQSCGAIIVKTAWSLFDLPEGAHTVLQIHDEWQIECDPDQADAVGEHVIGCIKQAGVKLGFRCPLDGEYKVGHNWSETH